MSALPEYEFFERAITRVQVEKDCWNISLACGHEVVMMTWPWAPKLMCAQCVNDYVEKQKLGRCPTCGSPSPQLHPAMQFEGEVQPCRDSWHMDKTS